MERIGAWEVVSLTRTDSTNLEAKRRAAAGRREPLLICALEQTAGRGRRDRRWVSPPGAGLWMTQLFFPDGVRAEDAGGAVFLSALAMCGTLRALTGAEVLIKWPNDLVLRGKKLCGMLAECSLKEGMCEWIALGTGLDLTDAPGFHAEGVPAWAGTVQGETGVSLTREQVLAEYLPRFDRLRALWEREGLAPVLRLLAPLSATVGRAVRLGESGVTGTALGLRADGALLIRTAEGAEQAVLAGDVSVRGITDYV